MKKFYAVMLITLIMGLLAGCGRNKAITLADADLKITGNVDTLTGWSDSQIRAMTSIDVKQVKKDGTTENRIGVLVMDLLNIAGIKEGATTVTFVSYDYSADILLEQLAACEKCAVAFQDDNSGFDMVLPGFAGKVQVKDVIEINVQ